MLYPSCAEEEESTPRDFKANEEMYECRTDENLEDDVENEANDLFEDGREGLDIEVDDLFADDEEDEANENDDAVMGDRELGKKQIDLEFSRARLDDGGEGLADDGGRWQDRESGWLRQFKAALSEERKQLLRGSPLKEADEDEGDEDEDDEVMARLRHVRDGVNMNGISADVEVIVGSRKRKPATVADEAKRLRVETTQASSARSMLSPPALPPAAAVLVDVRGTSVGLKVREKDIVQLLHRSGKITLKELIAHFKGYLKNKADKVAFRELVSTVSKLEKDGDTRYAILKNTMLYKYDFK